MIRQITKIIEIGTEEVEEGVSQLHVAGGMHTVPITAVSH